MLHRFFFCSLTLGLLSIAPSVFAESTHGDATTGTEKTGKRLAAEGKLSTDAVQFLSQHFFRSEEIIRQDYETKIPTAIEEAIQNKDETHISSILAPLVVSITPEQTKKVIENAEQEIKQETEGKDPGKYDTRYVALMERILWAAMNRIGQLPEKKQAEAFNNAFREPYIKARDFAKTANEKSKLAAQGNKEAKEWVDQNIRKDTVLSIAEGMRKTGSKEQGNNLILGQSMDLGNGQKALDMWGPGKEPQRLYLGANEKTGSEAIDRFLENRKTFGNNVTARKVLPNDKNLKSWYVGFQGKFQKGSPKGFEPKEEASPPPITSSKNTSPKGPVDTNISRLQQALVNGRCTDCHTLTIRGSSLRDAELVHPSKTVTLAEFATLFNNPSHPMNAPMRGNAAREVFEEFARIQRGDS